MSPASRISSIRALFDSALLKLTLIYTGILLLVSLIFSYSFYQVSVRELDANYVAQTQLLQQRSVFESPQDRAAFVEAQRSELNNSKEHVFDRLLVGNFIVLFGSTLLCYFLARRSLDPIEEAHAAQARFTADASHELRTPLAAMQTEIEVALRDPKLTKQAAKDMLASNLDELRKLSGLSDALLRLARNEDISQLQLKQHKLTTLASDAAQRLSGSLQEKQIKIEHNFSKKLSLRSDYDILAEVLVIILDNAIKYSPHKSTITISARARRQSLAISIADQGIGIDPQDLPLIFDRFYRADSSRSQPGYGLGLALAKQMTTMLGGSIRVKSTPGKGTTFTLNLPRV